MNSGEKQFDQQQSLAVIQKMIQNAKENLKDNGFFFLLWGWLVFAASISHYILLSVVHYEYHYLPWPILMTAGGIIAGIYGYKSSKQRQVKTYMDKFMAYLWGGFIISLGIVLGFMFKIGPDVAYPMIIILYGIGTFVSGGA